MKHIEYIEFNSGWRPPTHRGVQIRPIRKLYESVSKNGNPYNVFLGEISDEDATYLKVKDINAKIKDPEH
jgi:hypothetical protein